MKYFIALSFEHRKKLAPAISTVKSLLEERDDEYIVYVDRQFENVSNTVLMEGALRELDDSDALLVESSHKAVGVGIEVGVAYTLGMPVVLFRQSGTEPSTTLEGLASAPPILYESTNELRMKMTPILDILPDLIVPEHREDRWMIKGYVERAKREASMYVKRYLEENDKPGHIRPLEQRVLLLQFAQELLHDESFLRQDSFSVRTYDVRTHKHYQQTQIELQKAISALTRESSMVCRLNDIAETTSNEWKTEARTAFWGRPREDRYISKETGTFSRSKEK